MFFRTLTSCKSHFDSVNTLTWLFPAYIPYVTRSARFWGSSSVLTKLYEHASELICFSPMAVKTIRSSWPWSWSGSRMVIGRWNAAETSSALHLANSHHLQLAWHSSLKIEMKWVWRSLSSFDFPESSSNLYLSNSAFNKARKRALKKQRAGAIWYEGGKFWEWIDKKRNLNKIKTWDAYWKELD